jgi:iron complex transport system substrate-binding protein
MSKIHRRWGFALLLAALLSVLFTASGGASGPKTKLPTRIVSLSATATEDLFAVGAGGQVVAVDDYSNYPKNAPKTKLSGYNPNVEAIAEFRPDLVVLAGNANHVVEQLQKLGIRTLVAPPAANLVEVYRQINKIAAVTGHAPQGKRVVARVKRQIKAVLASAPRSTAHLSVYHELDQTYYSATSKTFIGQLYALLGLTNIADKAGAASDYPQLSAEYIIASNPDLIVLADTVCCQQTRAKVAVRPGWNTIAAVRRGDVVAIDDSIASEWGPRIVLFLRAIASAATTLEHRSQ